MHHHHFGTKACEQADGVSTLGDFDLKDGQGHHRDNNPEEKVPDRLPRGVPMREVLVTCEGAGNEQHGCWQQDAVSAMDLVLDLQQRLHTLAAGWHGSRVGLKLHDVSLFQLVKVAESACGT